MQTSLISPLTLQIKTTTVTKDKMEEHKLRDIKLTSRLKVYNLSLLIPEIIHFLLYHTIDLYFVLELYVKPFK